MTNLEKHENPIMVPGFGAQSMPAPEYVPANDNRTGLPFGGTLTVEFTPTFVDLDLINETFAPIEQLQTAERQPVTHDGTGYLPRIGDFMQTYTGRKFWPMDPRVEEIDIRDIAHSLAMQCRYAGHCKRFYSVAEHSTLMARWLRGQNGAEIALWGLLHDAAEAYLVDVPRPVKPYLDGYKDAERMVTRRICDRFDLPHEMPAEVREADNRILGDELRNLVPMDWHKEYNDPLGVPMMYWSPEEAKNEFLATFDALSAQVAAKREAA